MALFADKNAVQAAVDSLQGRLAALSLRPRASRTFDDGPIVPNHIAHEVAEDVNSERVDPAVLMEGMQDAWLESLTDAYDRAKAVGGQPTPKDASMLSRAFMADRATLADLAPFRARTAYRIVREHARLKGLISEDESLMDGIGMALRTEDDLWRNGSSSPPAPLKARRSEFIERNSGYRAAPAWHALPQLDGLALLPPRVPDVDPYPAKTIPPTEPVRWRYEATGRVTDDYDPHKDRDYMRWLDGCRTIAEYLDVQAGSLHDREQGRLGMISMLTPEEARLVWPTRFEIIAWESVLIDQAMTKMVEKGERKAVVYLGEHYGLTPREAYTVVRLARQNAVARVSVDQNEQRAMMIMQLDDYAERAREALNLAAEMNALKLKSLVLGLTATKPDDEMTEMIAAIGRVTGSRNTPRLLEGKDDAPVIDVPIDKQRRLSAS